MRKFIIIAIVAVLVLGGIWYFGGAEPAEGNGEASLITSPLRRAIKKLIPEKKQKKPPGANAPVQ